MRRRMEGDGTRQVFTDRHQQVEVIVLVDIEPRPTLDETARRALGEEMGEPAGKPGGDDVVWHPVDEELPEHRAVGVGEPLRVEAEAEVEEGALPFEPADALTVQGDDGGVHLRCPCAGCSAAVDRSRRGRRGGG